MSHSALFVFLVALAAIALVNAQKNGNKPCQGSVSKKRWGGACFGNNDELGNRLQCTTLIKDTSLSGCTHPDRPVCCVECQRQNNICNRHRRFSRDCDNKCTAQNVVGVPIPFGVSPCCNGELQIGAGEPRKGSGCYCCRVCKPRQACRGGNGVLKSRCITKYDPVYNEDWCVSNGGEVRKKACHGWGCWCCKF